MISLFNRNRENKKLNLFVLTKKDDPNRFLCIALSKDDVIEYAHSLIKFSHQAHFQAWCALRDYDYKSIDAWEEYFTNCISYEERADYIITNVSYKLKDVVAIMRMFGGCSPIGCSFETPVEYDHAKSKKEMLELQVEFERFWREHHKEEIEEAIHGIKQR